MHNLKNLKQISEENVIQDRKNNPSDSGRTGRKKDNILHLKQKNGTKKLQQTMKKTCRNLIPKELQFDNNFAKIYCNLLIIIILVAEKRLLFLGGFSFIFSFTFALNSAEFSVLRNKAPT
jgi:hypothetical protein